MSDSPVVEALTNLIDRYEWERESMRLAFPKKGAPRAEDWAEVVRARAAIPLAEAMEAENERLREAFAGLAPDGLDAAVRDGMLQVGLELARLRAENERLHGELAEVRERLDRLRERLVLTETEKARIEEAAAAVHRAYEDAEISVVEMHGLEVIEALASALTKKEEGSDPGGESK